MSNVSCYQTVPDYPMDNDEDAWKYQLSSVALLRMLNCNLWGNTLLGNCLPASLAVIDDVKKHHPDAKVVIGLLVKSDAPVDNASKMAIINFSQSKEATKPDFHAWIDLDGNDILDYVGPSWVNLNYSFFNRKLAAKDGYTHFSILQSPVEVDAFYKKLKALQLGQAQARS